MSSLLPFLLCVSGHPQLAATLRAELRRLAPGSTLVARHAYQVGLEESLAQNSWTNRMITVVLLVYAMIAPLNSLIMYELARRRELAILRLSGTTWAQVMRMALLEQMLLLGLALAVGVAIAAVTLIPTVKALTGSAAPYIPLDGWVIVIGGVAGLGGMAGLIPVRRVLRMPPVDAIGIRE